ncbi:MAG: hypothetical protein RJA98_1569 [Pseudomonadota bacterium]|jgi:two-component system sensor histidine kinase UhpB
MLSLRAQINLLVGGLTALLLALVLGLQFRAMRDSVHEEVVAANRVASQLLKRLAWGYTSEGAPAMQAFLQGLGRVRSNDITLRNAQGQLLYSSPLSPYKAGREAPTWFAGLIAPPLAEQRIDFADGSGLQIRSNASRAVLDAWDDLLMLLAAGLLLLAAVNALVFWRVGQAVQPLGQIVGALGALEAGRFDVMLPPLRGAEAGAIGAAFNRMVGVLRNHLATERRAAQAESELAGSRELTQWIDQQLEAERRLIARELHDELGQSVTAMRSMALSIAQRCQGVDAGSEQAARVIADESSRLYDAMHSIIPRLAPLVLDRFGLADALAELAERTRRSQPGLSLTLHSAAGDTPLSADAALTLYRSAQEGLTNALRHGQASEVQIRLQVDGAQAQIEVQDNGVGLAPGAEGRPGHHGLRWLAERAQALGGELQLAPALPQGLCLRVRLPLPRAVSAPHRPMP